MTFRMTVEDVFHIRNRGVVATGRVQNGILRVGDTVSVNGGPAVTVDAIEKFRKRLDEATTGENVGVLLKSIDKDQINRGDVITSAGEAPPLDGTNVILRSPNTADSHQLSAITRANRRFVKCPPSPSGTIAAASR